MKKIICALFGFLFLNTASGQDWVEVSPVPNDFRTDHSFGFALNGKGYLVTGQDYTSTYRADFYEYDPISDQWTQLPDFPGGARGYAIGDTWDGKAYFGFGSNNAQGLDDLWVFDPLTMQWTELASCPCEARTHPALVAHNGKVFVGMGGGQATMQDLKDWWIYDIATDTWSQGADLPAPRRHHPYQFAIGDYIYAGFGHNGPDIYNTWYRYDPSDDTWTQVASLPAEGRVAGTQFSWNGKGYALSGEGESHSTMPTGEFWSYDADADEWTELPPHPSNSRWAPASFIIDDEVYIINGVIYSFSPYIFSYEEPVYKFDLTSIGISATKGLSEKEYNLKVSPNPFGSSTSVSYNLKKQQKVRIDLLSSNGQLVKNIFIGEQTIGNQLVDLNVDNLPKGLYFLKIQLTEGVASTKLVIE